MIPTAISTTFPRIANFLNSCNIELTSLLLLTAANRGANSTNIIFEKDNVNHLSFSISDTVGDAPGNIPL
jgi:hypothetical protein